jgi:hypothetical protein
MIGIKVLVRVKTKRYDKGRYMKDEGHAPMRDCSSRTRPHSTSCDPYDFRIFSRFARSVVPISDWLAWKLDASPLIEPPPTAPGHRAR